ncbi:hypothetical protein [Streptomyces xinghaiensis]|uniref:hypothetical protein n=1 Tax=Streptomyces xinghaiensis TaxID=1038928 RepID=UPI002E0FEBC4|nr:hypothetical protein OG463_18920 [Streptomyces xinghaiensis]
MSIRHTAKARRGAAAVALAAGLLLAVAGCGGSDDGKSEAGSSKEAGRGEGSDKGAEQENDPEPEASETIGTLKGKGEIALNVHSVERDAGGFVTVNGSLVNNGAKAYFETAQWQGNEKEIVSKGHSLGGAALVDEKGKKRYYVLRDTEGRCLCTTGITKVDPGETIPVFVQFPAPPEGTTEVEFSLPTFDSATVEITE